MQKYLEQTQKEETKLWINSVLKNYLKKNEENQGEIEHIIDFLNSEDAPKRLLKMSYSQAKKSAEKWIEKLNKKAEKIEEKKEDTKIIKKYKNGYKIVKLVGKNAFDREGLLMKHCVSNYFGKENVEIFSLRDEDNMPHATFEIQKNGQQISQVKGKGNGSIKPKYIKYLLDFFKKIGKEIRDSEMENLGYYLISSELRKEIKQKFSSVEFFKNNEKDYLFLFGKIK